MNIISNQNFSHDAAKWVNQNPDPQLVNQGQPPSRPFKVSAPRKSEKSKKDVDKKKSQGEKSGPFGLI